ncbi:hypothetical protein HY448_00080, partial [Candidatus Pacearchaeota archaeon]|nr:hypothetical protein [Candidatus Pacearchaeota archaeon]
MKVIIPERVTMPQKPFLREDMPQRTLEELSKGIPRRKILSARVENADFGVA